MTTVINLNILNFFRLKQDNSTVNNVRSNTFISTDKQHEHSSEETKIIDVTPYSKVSTNDHDTEKVNLLAPFSHLTASKNYTNLIDKFSTYDRNGKKVRPMMPKGMHFDTYA